jgi:hypothetical protein
VCVFTVSIDKELYDAINQDTALLNRFKLKESDLNNYFGPHGLAVLDLQKIQDDTLDNWTVFDGRSFVVSFKYASGIRSGEYRYSAIWMMV